MKLTVNGRFQSQRTTGVQRYAREITARLAAQIDVLAPRGWNSGFRGHVWEQTVLPRLARGALLWSPCNTGPLSVERQVVTIHDCAFVDHPEAFSRPFAAWYTWLIPRLARRAQRVITVSRFSALRLAELCGLDEKQIEVIYNGVDARFHPASPENISALRLRMKLPARYLLSVGSIEPRKNLRRLLEAWELLKPAGEEIGLVLAGGAMPVFRDAGIDRLPPGVHLAGYVDDADLPTLYSGAEAFVYPSLYEGFGLTVLEAMACGAPVICSQTTSLPEVAGSAAVLVDPLAADQIASVMASVLSDDALRNQLRERGLQRAAQFSWEKSAAATANILRQTAFLN
jgi:glycosyltransferase involved in cell wall biosynthesis